MYLRLAKLNSLKVLSLLVLMCGAVSVYASGGSGGGGTVGPNPLPQTAPAPDVIYRESFGEGPDLLRPTSGKGALKTTYTHTPIQGFWIEYPGSKNTAWLAPAEGQTWRYCASSDNPYEMFSPIQMMSDGYYSNGCVASEWFDPPTVNPTALMPFTAPTEPYEVSFNGYPAPIDGKYLALGLTNSGTLYSNLETSASIVLLLKFALPTTNYILNYELRAGGINGTLLASGETFFDGFNRLKIRVDPVAKTVGANINDTEIGTFPLNIGAPKYAGFEGIGIGDNFVIRKLQ
jgi:hypothetical protein